MTGKIRITDIWLHHFLNELNKEGFKADAGLELNWAFTTNVVAATPVVYCKKVLNSTKTGDAGYQDMIECILKMKPKEVLIESTGVIGSRKMNLNNVKVPKMPGGGALPTLLKLGVIGGLRVYGIANSLYNVDGGHRAIVFNRIKGFKDEVYPEGTHFMVPWFERPVIYDFRARPHLVESTSGTHFFLVISGGYVKIGLRILTRPDAAKLPTIYRTLGENYNERVMPSIIHETLKVVVAQYNGSQLINQRENVSREIRRILTERARYFNILLGDVSITSLTFGKEFTAAIEAKRVAAQEAKRAKFIVGKAEQDKLSFVIQAQYMRLSVGALGICRQY
ncbi:Prohibitin [Corchorus olitorius]|uniref:Prohibitin n=1 Tax=Corchorus olitorius TaxID=93759 RepID=A0A1R3GBM4_9ROSI|nr:Prohibitin [Corchorus olitorius]